MKKNLKKLAAVLTSAVMAVMMATPAFADGVTETNYTDVAGTTTTFDKYLVMDKEANVPNASFTFSLEAGDAVDAGTGTLAVKAGLNPALVAFKLDDGDSSTDDTLTGGVLTFSSTDNTTDGSAGDSTVTDTTKKYAKKTVTMDFSAVDFPTPGIYRYKLSEAGTNQGIANDTAVTGTANCKRTVDVYVENKTATFTPTGGSEITCQEVTVTNASGDTVYYLDESGTYLQFYIKDGDDYTIQVPASPYTWKPNLEVTGYVMYEGWITAAPKTKAATTEVQANETATPPVEYSNDAAPEGANKNDEFINDYTTYDLEFDKTVTGNQGDKSEFFEFTLEIANAVAGTVYYVDLNNAVINDTSANATNLTAADTVGIYKLTVPTGETSVSKVFKLQHGQSIKVTGLAAGTYYTLTEDKDATNGNGTKIKKEGYTTNSTLAETNAATGNVSAVISSDKYEVKDVAATGGITSDNTISYTNTREGLVPTGIILHAAPAIIAALAILGVIFVLALRRKEEE